MTSAIESTAKANKGLIKRLIKRLPVNLPRASEFMNREERREEGSERPHTFLWDIFTLLSLPPYRATVKGGERRNSARSIRFLAERASSGLAYEIASFLAPPPQTMSRVFYKTEKSFHLF